MQAKEQIQAAFKKLSSSQFFTPTIVGGAVAFIVSTGFNLWTTVDKAQQETQQQAATFSKILSDSILTNNNAFSENGTVADEHKATVALLTLDAMAVTEQERRTVLYIGGKLLNPSTRQNTGGPGARFLDVSIGRLKTDIGKSWFSWHSDIRPESKELLELARSDGFVNLATAGYTTSYFNDDPNIAELQPTLYGDQPISSNAKLAVLADIGPDFPNAWIHLASWNTSLHAADWQHADTVAAAADLKAIARDQYDDYALFTGKAVTDPQPHKLADWMALDKGTLVLSRARLARALPPTVTYAGTTRAGALGRVIGAISPLECVDLLEAPKPVLVFVDDKKLGKNTTGLSGMIHLWAHVQARASCP